MGSHSLSMQTVFVGLSGGVDSAVSASLLKEQGYDVVGAFIKIWQPEFIECAWEKDRLDAMRVCVALGIPFREVDLSHVYKREIIADLVEGYRNGTTPNPDVLCNRIIKFGSFAQWAFAEGADMIATGHYAQLQKYGHSMSIFRGRDECKDQSYFLWQLTGPVLERVVFPVGGMTKGEVREYAQRRDLPVARKPDSQGLCFVGDVTMPEFLSRYVPLEPGDVHDKDGRVVGKHGGAAQYTVGQRHGFSITRDGDAPHYVVAVDVLNNTITVSRAREDAASKTARLIQTNWLHSPRDVFRAEAQARYRDDASAASLRIRETGADVTFDTPRIAARGQSLVCYRGSELLGGGIIESTRGA